MSVLPATVACVAVCVAVGLTGCADAGGVTQPPIQPPPDSVRFAAVVQPMFTQNCAFANCHAGATPQEGMNLSVGQAYGNTVNVAASQVPGLLRVRPGNPDSSYIVLKLEGNAGTVGGVGTRMPLGGSLGQAQIDTLRLWIAEGARNN